MAEEGAGSSKQIARLEKGNSERTARHAEVMNEIINRLNGFSTATVRITNLVPGVQPTGQFLVSDSNVVLELKTGAGFPTPEDTTKTYVWFAEFVEDAWVFSWRETEICDCGVDGGDSESFPP
jgi:hypothetical protein